MRNKRNERWWRVTSLRATAVFERLAWLGDVAGDRREMDRSPADLDYLEDELHRWVGYTMEALRTDERHVHQPIFLPPARS